MTDTATTTPVTTGPPTDAAAAAPATAAPPYTDVTPPPMPRRQRAVTRGGAALGWGLVGFATILMIWQLLGPDNLPTPGDVAARLRSDVADPFYDKGPNDKGIAILLWSSLRRVLNGFALACLVGVPLGLAMGTSTRWWRAANPVVQLFRPVSPLAWFPVWAIVFMDSERAGVWVIFMTALWPIVLNTATGAATVPTDQRNVSRVYRFGRMAYLRHVLIPNALPSIVTGLRLAFGMAWLVIVAVEMLSTTMGVGNDTWIAYNGGNRDQMMANIVWIGLLGLVVDLVFVRLVKRFTIEEVKA